MDTVDTFNHLTPSDQLDETLTLSQNLECEATADFGTESRLEESLKNMLSDKDPMFGCASTQFNLLDNEDPAFHIAGSAIPASSSESTVLTGELNVAKSAPVKQTTESGGAQQRRKPTNTLIRGRPRKKPTNRLIPTFLIEKGVRGPQLKKELTQGGRINISDLDGVSWLNPSVVLRRLTVTIGGFRIELLPGPSYTQCVDMDDPACFDDTFTYEGDMGMSILPEDAVHVENTSPENLAEMDMAEKISSDDGLGPYVNPNEVQTSNGTVQESLCTQETQHEDKNVPERKKAVDKGHDVVKHPHSGENDIAEEKKKHLSDSKADVKSKQQGVPSNKTKTPLSPKMSAVINEHKLAQNKPPKTQRGDFNKAKPLKDKHDASPLKRHSEHPHSDPAAKVQKVLAAGDDRLKPKSPCTPSSASKKLLLHADHTGDHHGPARLGSPPHHPHHAHTSHSHPSNSVKTTQEAGQEKFKVKKLEKILQRHKSRNSRSVSVDEPELFVPDNAPSLKKEASEEQAANSESVWDGNNCCGLCKKHHNNMFMVGCGRCEDWFHGDCVGLDLAKVREMEEEDQMYVCLKCCEEETKKVEPSVPVEVKPEVHERTEHHKSSTKQRPESSEDVTSGGVRPVRKEPERRQSTEAKEAAHKTGFSKSKSTYLASKKPVSVEAIRRSVRDSLKDILTHRLKESDLSVSVEKACEVAKKIERELFHLYKDTDHKYKNKYRSLMFNLKDTKNNVLFKRVLKGEVSPANLIRLSPEELASKELAAWRQRENRHTIEMIEKEQREAERRPITKITHKGEIEIESQEPMKAPEPVELEPLSKVTEILPEMPKTPEKDVENTKTDKDTTSQHKSHLFDLHCKICTGRMAPPVEEAQTKVAKVATTVVRRHSSKSEEGKGSTPPAAEDDLHLTVLEESFRNAQSGYEPRSDHAAGRDDEAAFLSGLKSLWRGFIHMHSVAKLVTKAFPVSGVLDNLTEDLPDSILVGGRISPQTVWDYLEKIRATGTKEVCLVRFSPETEEDEISYTLLYAYFSSRKRFGVVSNNLKQVKDMYLIPLGGTEKVPHQLVPFDGPGLENNRSNLLLGLIIRQRPKREFLPVDVKEAALVVPEVKPIPVPSKPTRSTEEDENLYLSSLKAPQKKEEEKPKKDDAKKEEPPAEPFEEPAATEEPASQQPQKPLRFLPGVLLGWGGELPPLPEAADNPETLGHDSPKNHAAPKSDASDAKSPTAAAPRFVIKKKETKPNKAEPELAVPDEASAPNSSSGKDAAEVIHKPSVTLKDKPPDVSTEAFLAAISGETSGTDSSAELLPDAENLLQSESPAAPDLTKGSKPLLSGILKKSSAYSAVNEDKTVVLQKDKASPKPAAVSSSVPLLPFHQGYLQLSQARQKMEEQNQTFLSKENPKMANPPEGQGFDAAFEPHSVKESPPDQPLIPGINDISGATPSNTLSSPDTEDLSFSMHGSQNSSSLAEKSESLSESSGQMSPTMRDYRHANERYTDPWERPRNSDDHHGRHSHHREIHHNKKSRHHEKEKRHEHGHEENYRERSRHHGHLEDRHGERRKERHHEYSGHHKDKHRHRRDSDYENGRRSSKDSY